jgi:transposase
MTKIRKEYLLEAIHAVEGGESIRSAARRYQMSEDGISRSVRLYRQHGSTGLSSNNYKWTAEQKYQVLEYMHENHLSWIETGIQFGISGSATIWQWEQRYLENGKEGLEKKKKGRKPRVQKPKPPKTREEELLEKIQDQQMEIEYLKKLNTLVAEREKREEGIK